MWVDMTDEAKPSPQTGKVLGYRVMVTYLIKSLLSLADSGTIRPEHREKLEDFIKR